MAIESFGGAILFHVRDLLLEYQGQISPVLGSSFRGFFRMFVLLYVVVVGYRVMMGIMGERTKDAAISIALVGALHALIAESGTFYAWIADPILSTAYGLSNFFADGGAGDGMLFTRLDKAIGEIIDAVERIEPGGNIITSGMIYIKVSIAGFVLLLVTCGLYLVSLLYVTFAFVAIHILLIVAPPFIFFAAFTETRFITWTWFKTLMNYVVWLALLSLVMRLGTGMIEDVARGMGNWDVIRDGVFTRNYAVTVGFSLLMIYFLGKTSDLAAALTGGMGMQSNLAGSSLGAMRAAGGIGLNAAASAVKPLVATTAAGAAGTIRAYSIMKGIIK